MISQKDFSHALEWHNKNCFCMHSYKTFYHAEENKLSEKLWDNIGSSFHAREYRNNNEKSVYSTKNANEIEDMKEKFFSWNIFPLYLVLSSLELRHPQNYWFIIWNPIRENFHKLNLVLITFFSPDAQKSLRKFSIFLPSID